MMITWGDGQSLAICRVCHERLNSPVSPAPFCSYHEASPEVLRSSSLSDAIQVRTEIPDGGDLGDDDGTESIFHKALRWLME